MMPSCTLADYLGMPPYDLQCHVSVYKFHWFYGCGSLNFQIRSMNFQMNFRIADQFQIRSMNSNQTFDFRLICNQISTVKVFIDSYMNFQISVFDFQIGFLDFNVDQFLDNWISTDTRLLWQTIIRYTSSLRGNT